MKLKESGGWRWGKEREWGVRTKIVLVAALILAARCLGHLRTDKVVG